jgi:Calcineurin-like phosphoesterase
MLGIMPGNAPLARLRTTPGYAAMAASALGHLTVIGDVHGWADRLHAVLSQATGNVLFVGDLIDRGPRSDQVLDRVHGLCDAGRAQCLMGNHEWMLVRSLGRGDQPVDEDAFAAWIDGWGGDAVLAAYGVTDPVQLKQRLRHHWPWLCALPWVLDGELADGSRWIAVHAGLDPRRRCADQLAELRLGWDGPWSTSDDPRPPCLFSKRWLRDVPADVPPRCRVISGHTPQAHALLTSTRILCDTSGGQPGRHLSGVVLPDMRVIAS